MRNLISLLCAERGISGDEGRVRQAIEQQLADCCRLRCDRLGNLIAEKDGTTPKNKIVFFAHMDEVGLLVTHITEQGLLKFSSIGMDALSLHGRRVIVGENALPGVVGAKVWHHLEDSEKDTPINVENLFVDIGAGSREEAAALVAPGDAMVLDTAFVDLGSTKFASRALDNRIGCALLIKLLKSDLPYALTGVFSCGEESSMFGAKAAATATAPEIAVILETTTAGDIPNTPPDKVVCRLGKGPVVSFADRGTLYDRELYKLAFDTAAAHNIPVQTKEGIFGGNESRVVIGAGDGARVLAVSVPCRYLHGASCVADLKDVNAALALIKALIGVLAEL